MRGEALRYLALTGDIDTYKWWGVFYPVTGERLISHIEYEKLISKIQRASLFSRNNFILINHNKELLCSDHVNILDSREFSLKTIIEVADKVSNLQRTNVTYAEISMGKATFLGRLDSLVHYCEMLGRIKESEEIDGIIESAISIRDSSEVIITNEPNLFISDKKLHPDIVCKPIIRRMLMGFVTFYAIKREDLLLELTRTLKQSREQLLEDLV